jgi:hypothetical protein
MNLYSFVANSPVNWVDPWGLQQMSPSMILVPVFGWIPIMGEICGVVVVLGLTWGIINWILKSADDGNQDSNGGNSSSGGSEEGDNIPRPKDFKDPNKSPGEDWKWKGKGTPESGKGNWHNEETGKSLHPDLNHGAPKGPHWGYKGPEGDWDIFPDGSIKPNP